MPQHHNRTLRSYKTVTAHTEPPSWRKHWKSPFWGNYLSVPFCHFQCHALIACWLMAVFCTVHLVCVVLWSGCNMRPLAHTGDLWQPRIRRKLPKMSIFGALQRPKMLLGGKLGGWFQGLLFQWLAFIFFVNFLSNWILYPVPRTLRIPGFLQRVIKIRHGYPV